MPRTARRRPWWAIAVSVVLHVALLLFGWVGGRMPSVPPRAPNFIVLTPPADSADAVEMRWDTGQRPEGRTGSERLGERRAPRPERRRSQPPAVVPEPEALPEIPVDSGVAVSPEPAPPPPPQPSPLIGRIGPGLAEGRLWVRPLPLPPQELAQRLKKTHVELVDSAVTAIVQGYLDSIASDPTAREAGLPSWTTNVAGSKFGLDSQNIYVAGLKIPAAVLALLPIGGGNVDRDRAYTHLMEMRADLQRAAVRAQNLEEFKEIIRDIRERKEREREFERNQRTAPPPDEPPTQ